MGKPNDNNIVKRTSQYIDNLSFDEVAGLAMVELAGVDSSGNVNRVYINADGSAGNPTERFDTSTAPVYYIGSAAPGTATSSAAWYIKKYDLTTSSAMSGLIATNAIWDNRATSVVYS